MKLPNVRDELIKDLREYAKALRAQDQEIEADIMSEAADDIEVLRKQVEEAGLSAALHGNAAGQLAQMAVDSVSDGPEEISSAPKDGTPILAFIPSWYQAKGGWCVVLWHKDDWYTVTGTWRVKPSHWATLPAAPSATPSAFSKE